MSHGILKSGYTRSVQIEGKNSKPLLILRIIRDSSYSFALKLKPFDFKPFGASYIHIQGKYDVTGRFTTSRIL